MQCAQRHPACLAQDDVLERPNLARRVGADDLDDLRAEATDRARRDLDDHGDIIGDADLRMDWPPPESARGRRPANRFDDRELRYLVEARRGHIDGLLEERPGQRIRLVEQSDHLEKALAHKAFERDLDTVDVTL